jgi:hypothetical protein
MRADGDGLPACGPSSRMLGVRVDVDIAVRDDGTVAPRTGGMSVAVGGPESLPRHRRPSEFGGWGRDAVWQMEEEDLPESLAFRPDPAARSSHGFVEPIRTMTLADYQEALATSRGLWRRT